MPNIVLTTDELPEITDWQNGETYTVTLEVKQIGGGPDKKSFEIVSAQSESGGEEGGEEMPMHGSGKSEGDGMQEPQEIMANGGSSNRQKMVRRMKQKAQQY